MSSSEASPIVIESDTYKLASASTTAAPAPAPSQYIIAEEPLGTVILAPDPWLIITLYGPLDPESVVAFITKKYAATSFGATVTVLLAPRAPVNLSTRYIPA